MRDRYDDDYYDRDYTRRREREVVREVPSVGPFAQPQFSSTDRPMVGKDEKRFIRKELRQLMLRSIVGVTIALILSIVAGALIAFYVTGTPYKFSFEASISGEAHLAWMGLGAFVGLVFLLIYGMRLYLVRKDYFRARTLGQNDFYVPLSLKKYYRSLKSNNTFIHYFAFLGYLALLISMLIVFLISDKNTFINESYYLIKNTAEFNKWMIIFGIALGGVFIMHVTFIALRYRKANIYDGKFGHEIVPKEQIIALRKRNRKDCIFITLVILLLGVIVYFIVRKFRPSVPNLLSLKK